MHKPEQRTISQRVEYCNGEVVDLHCPFCGQLVMPSGEDPDMEMAPCAHTLYIATDAGFEHRSKTYDELMEIEGVANDDLDLGDATMDEFTDALEEPTVLKFAQYAPSPSLVGVYVGFGPFPVE